MLIVDMPMPKNCMSCPFSSSCSFCEGYDDYCVLAPKDAKYKWNFCDGKEPKERPSWCPIKGEIVPCDECVHKALADAGCCMYDRNVCVSGERKDGEHE